MIRTRATYSNCSELPLYNFIKIVVYDRLESLYSEKKYMFLKEADLEAVWQSIYEEYNSLSGNSKHNHIFSLVREIAVLSHRLQVIQSAIDFLSTDFDEKVCQLLRKMGFKFNYKPDTMARDLKLTVSTAKQLLIKKQDAEKELNDLNKDSQKITEKEYNAQITRISKYMGFKINPKETSVLDFVNYQEAYYQDSKIK